MFNNKLTYKRYLEFIQSKTSKDDLENPKYLNGFFLIRTTKFFNDKYSDFCFYVEGGIKKEIFACTTRAGKFWVYNPITYGGLTGVAVLKEGYYPKTWQAVLTYRFGFKSIELLQVRPVIIGRDGNRNDVIDYTNMQEGYFGIDLHIGGLYTQIVHQWSKGCIVIPQEQYPTLENMLELGKLYDIYLVSL
jgi:hypothetical protein